MPTEQARYWICTIPRDDWEPALPDGCSWCIGQPEVGETGYRHWQIMLSYPTKKTRRQVKQSIGVQGCHLEPTRSSAAEAYVCKEATRDGEPFEFGRRVFNRNRKTDWDEVKQLACQGKIDEIPSDIYVRYYRTLMAIAADNEEVVGLEKVVNVYYGKTGTGKSRSAWDEAGSNAYPKDPRSKFWCGYKGQRHVIIDEFRGGIDISHMLRWLDRYPVRVEIKGSSRPLCADKLWITSNLHPEQWYPEIDSSTRDALMRRLILKEFE